MVNDLTNKQNDIAALEIIVDNSIILSRKYSGKETYSISKQLLLLMKNDSKNFEGVLQPERELRLITSEANIDEIVSLWREINVYRNDIEKRQRANLNFLIEDLER